MMAVRDYRDGDLGAIKAMVCRDNRLTMKQVEDLLSKGTRLVYDDGAIKGCIIVGELRKTGRIDLHILVDPACRGQGIGRRLWDAIQPMVELPEVSLMASFFVSDCGHSREFFYSLGFRRWFGTHLMYYRGGKLPEPDLEARPYDDALYVEHNRLINDGFAPMRQYNDIKPYRIYGDDAANDLELRRKTDEAHRENFWFFYHQGQLVGLAELNGAEIDTIAVALEHQRKGYGRQIMHYCVNRLLEQGHNPVQLHVVESNLHVKRFYETLGFELVESYEHVRQMK